MTNANVATTVAGKDGQDLLVKYKDGEKKVAGAGWHSDRQVRGRAAPTTSRSASQGLHRRAQRRKPTAR